MKSSGLAHAFADSEFPSKLYLDILIRDYANSLLDLSRDSDENRPNLQESGFVASRVFLVEKHAL